jgi:glycosyltransferase involved in cell wall biosynthesis
MRVALVDPYFITTLGYQISGWFNAFVARGHAVRAFCSPYVFSLLSYIRDEPYPLGLTKMDGGEVLRLPSRQLPRDVCRCTGLIDEVAAFKPDLTMAIYPGTLFANELFTRRDRLPGVLFSLFGENSAMRRGMSPLKVAMLDLAFFLVKRRTYRLFLERSDVVLFQTPDTFDFNLNRIAWGRHRRRLRTKCVPFTLGFDSSLFYFDSQARQAERKRLGIADDEVTGVYSCKIEPVKRLDLWVSVMASAMRRVPKLRAMLIGIRKGHDESDRILKLIEKTGHKDRFVCLPFAPREELARLYNAADFGVWYMQPSLTIQESMGTGLYMLLNNGRTVCHLLLDPQTGRYFGEGEFGRLEHLVTETAEEFLAAGLTNSLEARVERAKVNASRFGYLALADRLAVAAQDLSNAASHLTFYSLPSAPGTPSGGAEGG